MPGLSPIARARSHAGSVAFRTATGLRTYRNLLDRTEALAAALLAGEEDLSETRISLLVSPGIELQNSHPQGEEALFPEFPKSR